MDYSALSHEDKRQYLLALFALVRDKYEIYERVYNLLSAEKLPPLNFLDSIYQGVFTCKEAYIESKSHQSHSKLTQIQHAETLAQEDLSELEAYFTSEQSSGA